MEQIHQLIEIQLLGLEVLDLGKVLLNLVVRDKELRRKEFNI
jgi:hypothetical protein